MNKIKVLQINSGSREFGGVSSILFSIFEKIDKNQISFDFLTPEFSTYNLRSDQIKEMGGKIFDFKITEKKFSKLFKTMFKVRKFLNENNYNVVHINSGSFIFNLFVSAGVKFSRSNVKIIVHSHNSLEDKITLKNLAIKLLKPLLIGVSDYQIACSLKAAKSMYPKCYLKNVDIFFNAVDLNRFQFNLELRNKIRNELGISDNKVLIGNIGRLSYQKNQIFLLRIFKSVLEKNSDFRLVIIGKGPDKDKISNYIFENGLQDYVYIIDETNNINAYYSAFDVFVLPSKYEGLPLVGVEAQATGLRLIVSDAVTEEVNITNRVQFINLDDDNKWISSILNTKISNMRFSNRNELKNSGYMLDDVVKKYEKLYIDILKEEIK